METSSSAPRFIGAVEDHWQLYSDRSEDYVVGAPIGFGASSIVYAATYHPPNGPPAPCALKVLDLDSLPLRSWTLLHRETTLMSLSKHPNVLRVRGSWMDGHKLYIALRLMNKGSVADVMRYGWPGGMEEDVVKSILQQALQGLNYLHTNGFIHRDVKAANLLIDDDGTVLLGDLGVAADLSEGPTNSISSQSQAPHLGTLNKEHKPPIPLANSNRVVIDGAPTPKFRIHKRKSFVGTPCWMAPELIQGKQYDSSADIWSFGITALELAQGRAPRSREPPQKVLLRTIQEDPPTLDRTGGAYKYSKAFQELAESCLDKDPSKRPTAAQLLESPFFRGTKKKSYLINSILKDLPPLTKRQERRAIPNMMTYHSIDSWDFSIHSVPVTPTSPQSKRGTIFGTEDNSKLALYSAIHHSSSHSTTHIQSPPPEDVEEIGQMDPLVTEPEPTPVGPVGMVSREQDPSPSSSPPSSSEEDEDVDDEPSNSLSTSPEPSSPRVSESEERPQGFEKSSPIPISKARTPALSSSSSSSSLQPQEGTPSTSISSTFSSPLSSSAATSSSSRAGKKDNTGASASSSRKGSLWKKIRSKTSSNVKKVASLNSLTIISRDSGGDSPSKR